MSATNPGGWKQCGKCCAYVTEGSGNLIGSPCFRGGWWYCGEECADEHREERGGDDRELFEMLARRPRLSGAMLDAMGRAHRGDSVIARRKTTIHALVMRGMLIKTGTYSGRLTSAGVRELNRGASD